MNKFRILWKKSAVKELQEIPKEWRISILNHIDKLTENAKPSNSLKLKGISNFYRIRIGDYRIIYSIQNEMLTIEIIKIGHRKEVYRDN